MDRELLRATYGISDARLRDARMTWDDLQEIETKYASIRGGLDSVGRYVVDALLRCPTVHSIKYRLKESDRLLEKIVRKRCEDPTRTITAFYSSEPYGDHVSRYLGRTNRQVDPDRTASVKMNITRSGR